MILNSKILSISIVPHEKHRPAMIVKSMFKVDLSCGWFIMPLVASCGECSYDDYDKGSTFSWPCLLNKYNQLLLRCRDGDWDTSTHISDKSTFRLLQKIVPYVTKLEWQLSLFVISLRWKNDTKAYHSKQLFTWIQFHNTHSNERSMFRMFFSFSEKHPYAQTFVVITAGQIQS